MQKSKKLDINPVKTKDIFILESKKIDIALIYNTVKKVRLKSDLSYIQKCVYYLDELLV